MGNQYSHECPMITAAPLQENLFEWHINMCATNGILQNTIIHLIATFPPNYPKQPPTIRVCSFFPHPTYFMQIIGNMMHVANGNDVETKTIIIFVWICLNAKVTLINGLKILTNINQAN